MTVYIDASVIVAIVGNEPNSAAVDRLVRHYDDVLVSNLAVAESSAALARNGRVAGWTTAQANGFFHEMDTWSQVWTESVEIVSRDITDATALTRREGFALRAPDAIHIAAARRLDATLITLDRGMARAARTLGMACINPAESSA